MWLVIREMADCMALWTTSYCGSDFHRPWNLCSDEAAFTDDDGKEVTSLLDDLAEAKRHNSTDDIDNDVDSDCISLWDSGLDEQWTTKDVNSGPTLAELNGGELTDMEQYESLRVGKPTTKRKRQRSSGNDAFRRSGRSLTSVPEPICEVNDEHLLLQTVQRNRSMTVETDLRCDKEGDSVSSGEEQSVKVCQKFIQDVQLKSVSLPHQPRLESTNVHGTSDRGLPSCSKNSLKSDASETAHEFRASKKIKTHHGGLFSLFRFWGLFLLLFLCWFVSRITQKVSG